ncbi:MAG: RNA pyrophosphohydrolase [Alphaproteobacteria bacterium]|nr:RNA pyrophosphohydrolase [Alphaproteobacteria bacterium]
MSGDYRPCVGVMLVNLKGQVFVGRRAGIADAAWQMPQGGIDKGEAPPAAARRELREEVGVVHASILAEHPEWLSYDLPPRLARRTWRGRFKGQIQKWFLMRLEGPESEIDLRAHRPPEFDAWRWAELDELESLIVPFKRDVYRLVVAEFRPQVRQMPDG